MLAYVFHWQIGLSDVWQYIYREKIPVVPLYFAQERAIVERNGMLILVNDDRLKLRHDEEVQLKTVRFRSLGCYPLTGAIESNATDLPLVIDELITAKNSERRADC